MKIFTIMCYMDLDYLHLLVGGVGLAEGAGILPGVLLGKS